MLRHTLTALDQLASLSARFRKQLPARAHPTLEQLEGSIRPALSLKEAYSSQAEIPKAFKHPSRCSGLCYVMLN